MSLDVKIDLPVREPRMWEERKELQYNPPCVLASDELVHLGERLLEVLYVLQLAVVHCRVAEFADVRR